MWYSALFALRDPQKKHQFVLHPSFLDEDHLNLELPCYGAEVGLRAGVLVSISTRQNLVLLKRCSVYFILLALNQLIVPSLHTQIAIPHSSPVPSSMNTTV